MEPCVGPLTGVTATVRPDSSHLIIFARMCAHGLHTSRTRAQPGELVTRIALSCDWLRNTNLALHPWKEGRQARPIRQPEGEHHIFAKFASLANNA